MKVFVIKVNRGRLVVHDGIQTMAVIFEVENQFPVFLKFWMVNKIPFVFGC